MKKLALTLFIAGSALGLTACDTTATGNIETAAPYEMERTATHAEQIVKKVTPVRAERTFRQMQTK